MTQMPKPPCCRRLPLATLIACLFSPLANAQPSNGGALAYHDDYSQVGVGVDDEGNINGEVKYLLSGTANSGTIGEAWAGDGAGGLKLSHNWIPLDADGKPDRTTAIRKAFAALDQNGLQDRKFTLGGGIENGRGFAAAYLSHAVSGSRRLSTQQETETTTLSGFEDGRPYVDTVTSITTINTYEHPFDWGIGVRVGRYLPEHGLQVSLGADHEWGDNDSSQTTLSLDMEKYFQASPWSVALRAESAFRDGDAVGRENDTRGWLMLRYAFSPAPRTPATYTIRTLAPTAKAEPPKTEPSSAASAAPPAPASRPTATASPGDAGNIVPGSVVTSAPLEPKVYNYRTEKRLIKTTASMTADTFFKFDSAALTPSANDELGKIAAILNNQGYADKISLTGHTCDIGSEAYNEKLSLRRAESVKKNLVEQGHIKADDITAIGKGESEPAYPNNRDSRHKNRRVDLSFLTYVDKEETITVPVEPTVAVTPPATVPPTPPAAAPAPAPTPAELPAKKAEAAAPAIVWQREEVEPEPDWIQHGLFGSIPHKRTVDYYRVTQRTVTTSTERDYVNREPLAGNDSYTVLYGMPLSLAVLANDSDPDNDGLRIASVTQPSQGTVTISGNGLVYTPNSAEAAGADSFSYTVTDDQGGTATATVTLTLVAANQGPQAVNDFYMVPGIGNTVLNVLANDSDPEGDPLTILSYSQPALGTVTLDNGALLFSSSTIFMTLSFTYTIGDGNGGTSTAVVTLLDP